MPALNKYSLVGVGVQTNEGEQFSGTYTWLPLAGELGFNEQMNPEVIDMADRNHYNHQSYSKGQWWAGGIPIFLYPGAVSTMIDWIQTRDDNNQGKLASVWITQAVTGDGDALTAGTNLWRSAIDVKVSAAEFTFTPGELVRLNLDCVGKASGSVETKPTGYATTLQANPYLWKECTLSLGMYGSTPPTDYTITSMTVNINNSVDDPAAGMRFNGSYNPYRLYNNGGCVVTGSFTRDYSDLTLYNAYIGQYTAAAWYTTAYNLSLALVITNGATTMTLTMPNVRITDYSAQPTGSRRDRIVENVSFEAFGSAAGDVAPLALS